MSSGSIATDCGGEQAAEAKRQGDEDYNIIQPMKKFTRQPLLFVIAISVLYCQVSVFASDNAFQTNVFIRQNNFDKSVTNDEHHRNNKL